MKKVLIILTILIVIVAVYYGAHFVSAYKTIVVSNEGDGDELKDKVSNWLSDKDNIYLLDKYPLPEKEENRIDILVLGMRGEEDKDVGGYLTDTMMLLSVDNKTGQASMVSIPRDIYLNMPGLLLNGDQLNFKGKINELYVRGLEHNQGLSFASQMISRITGVYVDKAVVFDFKAFEEIINTLGGVDVYLNAPFSEKTQWGFEFSLPAGKNHLDGEQVLYYVRSRFSSSDFDRSRRQQQVMLAMKAKASELGLFSLKKVTELLNVLKGNVRTNIQVSDMGDMISIAKSVKSENLKRHVVTTDNLLYETHLDNGEYVLLPKGDDFKLFKEYFKTVLNN